MIQYIVLLPNNLSLPSIFSYLSPGFDRLKSGAAVPPFLLHSISVSRVQYQSQERSMVTHRKRTFFRNWFTSNRVSSRWLLSEMMKNIGRNMPPFVFLKFPSGVFNLDLRLTVSHLVEVFFNQWSPPISAILLSPTIDFRFGRNRRCYRRGSERVNPRFNVFRPLTWWGRRLLQRRLVGGNYRRHHTRELIVDFGEIPDVQISSGNA